MTIPLYTFTRTHIHLYIKKYYIAYSWCLDSLFASRSPSHLPFFPRSVFIASKRPPESFLASTTIIISADETPGLEHEAPYAATGAMKNKEENKNEMKKELKKKRKRGSEKDREMKRERERERESLIAAPQVLWWCCALCTSLLGRKRNGSSMHVGAGSSLLRVPGESVGSRERPTAIGQAIRPGNPKDREGFDRRSPFFMPLSLSFTPAVRNHLLSKTRTASGAERNVSSYHRARISSTFFHTYAHQPTPSNLYVFASIHVCACCFLF